MSKIVLIEKAGRIFAGHLTNAGDGLRPGCTDVTKQVMALLKPEPLGVEDTIAAGFKTYGYAQGTGACVAFCRGVWYAEEMHGIQKDRLGTESPP